MIVFINGSFGVGKTTAAELLVSKLPNSLLFDAEEVGSMLQKVLRPIDWSGDFQDYPMWRGLTVDVAGQLRERYGRDLVMPMTIWRTDYFEEVMSGLRIVDADVRHFCLTAPREVIRSRVLKRGEQKEGDWVFAQIERCVESFQNERFEEKIDSLVMSSEEIVNHILERVSATR